MVEHLICNQRVGGSSPSASSTKLGTYYGPQEVGQANDPMSSFENAVKLLVRQILVIWNPNPRLHVRSAIVTSRDVRVAVHFDLAVPVVALPATLHRLIAVKSVRRRS